MSDEGSRRTWIHRRRCLGAVVVAVSCLGGAACSDRERIGAFAAEAGPVSASPQRPGDPRLGYDIIVSGSYMTCGMPYAAWRRVAGPVESSQRLPGEPDSDLPYYLSRSEDAQGVEVVNTNCLLCHAALFNGQPVIGLGNESLDFTNDPRALPDAIGAYVVGKAQADAWRKWADRLAAIAPYMITDTVGVNPALTLTLALIAHRDPETLSWSETPLIEPPPQRSLPLSVPPWWRMSKKHAMFYNAMGRGDHARYMMMKSLVCTDTTEEAEAIDDMFTHVRAYVASLEPPKYPFPIDEALAANGRAVFEDECSSCHGTYGPEVHYPNLVIELDEVGTDPAYAIQAYTESERFMSWFNKSWYGDIAVARPALGYIAPPLDGVWATAPFLHNGSVPTIRALLDSSERPTFWIRSFDSTDFDQETLGWRYETLEHGKINAGNDERSERIYDTTLQGYANSGHTFGENLSGAERAAVIEYLKTL